MSQAQLQSGLTEHILEKPCDNLNIIIKKGQIQHLHDRLNDLGGEIWIENAWKPNLQRVGDKSLMKTFLSTRGRVKKSEPRKTKDGKQSENVAKSDNNSRACR